MSSYLQLFTFYIYLLSLSLYLPIYFVFHITFMVFQFIVLFLICSFLFLLVTLLYVLLSYMCLSSQKCWKFEIQSRGTDLPSKIPRGKGNLIPLFIISFIPFLFSLQKKLSDWKNGHSFFSSVQRLSHSYAFYASAKTSFKISISVTIIKLVSFFFRVLVIHFFFSESSEKCKK